QDEIALAGMHQEIRVLDPLGNAFVGQQLADVVAGEKRRKVLRRNIGVDGHQRLRSNSLARYRGPPFPRQGKTELAIAQTTLECLYSGHFPVITDAVRASLFSRERSAEENSTRRTQHVERTTDAESDSRLAGREHRALVRSGRR